MNLSNESLLVIILVGIVAGWLAGQIMQGTGFGLIGDLIIGLLGAFIGSWLLPQLHIHLGVGLVAALVPIRTHEGAGNAWYSLPPIDTKRGSRAFDCAATSCDGVSAACAAASAGDAPPLKITLTLDKRGVTVSWPETWTGFSLHTTPDLGSPWIDLEVAYGSDGKNRSAVLPSVAARQYFRARKP